jgi:hypothetical protein
MSLQDDLNRASKNASRGDVYAGICLIIELVSAAVVGAKLWAILLAAKAALVAVAPWTAPIITPTMVGILMKQLANGYASMDSEKRQVIAAALGWLTGRVKLVD